VPENPQDEPKGPVYSQTPIKHLILFCVVVFFFWVALFLYVPVLPVYSQSLGATLPMVGAIVAAYGLPQLFLRIPVGMVFDAINRRRLLLIAGILISCIGALALALSSNPWMLFAARVVTGIGAATWVSFIVYFAAYYAPQNVQRPVGIINFVFWAGLMAGSYGGGWVTEVFGYKNTFFLAAVLGIVALVLVFFVREPVVTKTEPIVWSRLKTVVSYPPMLLIALFSVLLTFVDFATVFSFLPVYGATIGATSADLGLIITLALAFAAVGSLVVVRLVNLLGNRLVIVISAILLGVTTLAIPWIQDVSLLKAIMLFNGLGRGFSAAIAMSLSMQAVAPQQRATALGIVQASFALGALLGPTISGFIAESWGLPSVFYLSALCCVAVGVIAYLPTIKRLELA